jgi:hypothetical protein
MKFDAKLVGLYTGLIFAVLHACWALLVMFGWAKGILDFVFGLHFLTNPYVVKPFSFTYALELIVFVFVVWFILGYLSTIAWNKMQKGR